MVIAKGLYTVLPSLISEIDLSLSGTVELCTETSCPSAKNPWRYADAEVIVQMPKIWKCGRRILGAFPRFFSVDGFRSSVWSDDDFYFSYIIVFHFTVSIYCGLVSHGLVGFNIQG